jgi:polysaccharide export outer membrane protein
MRLLNLLLAALGLCLLSGCATPPPTTGSVALHTALVAPYRLDSGDRLRVIVFGQTDLSNTYAIDQSGQISMPLIGALPARGRTTAEMETAIAAKLRGGGFVRSPDVSVEVDRYRPFFAMGEVAQPGQYAYVTGLTVQAAIAIAGGFSPRANRNYVDVTRSYNGQVETGRLQMTDPLMPGDTIVVRESIF